MVARLATLAASAGLILPGGNAAVAHANPTPQHDPGDRYELVAAKIATAQRPQRRSPKTGTAAAKLVVRVANRVGKKYDLDCRWYQTELGAKGVVECKGSARGKRELARQIRRLIREDKLIAPEDHGWYVGVWTENSQKLVRIDWLRFGYFGIPV